MTRSPADRSHLSIGEVLSLLQDEFPDVTISKIRFLESQGLLDPERTPSGYRKFYDADIQRLRWILRQQKEHYLPLKVIKDRLDGLEDLSEPPDGPDEPTEAAASPAATAAAPVGGGSGASRAVNGRSRSATAVDDRPDLAEAATAAAAAPAPAPPVEAPAAAAAAASAPASGSSAAANGHAADGRRRGDGRSGRHDGRARAGAAAPRRGDGRAERTDGAATTAAGPSHADAIPVESVLVAGEVPTPPPPPAPPPAPPERTPPAPTASASSSSPGGSGDDAPTGSSTPPPRAHPSAGTVGQASAAPAPPPVPAAEAPALAGYADLARYADLGGEPGTAVSLTIDELAEASGMTVRDLRELEKFGLLESHLVGDAAYYDAASLVVARTAGGFLRHGIEARHLRSYKVAVDREAGLFEQIVLPLLKQRNPEAHRRANRIVAELVHLGEAMRGTLLRRELRDHID